MLPVSLRGSRVRGDLDAMAEAAKSSLYILCSAFLGYKDITWGTHGSIIEALEDEDSKRKLICVPRGCLKSSIACVAYPIWKLVRDPNRRFLLDSELYTNSTTFLREIKAHLQTEQMTMVFGDFRSRVWREDEIIIKQRTKNYKEASITCGGVGTTKVGQHFSDWIMDDMNSPKNTGTPEGAKKVIDHYKYGLSILEPDGTIVVIGTRYSANDLIGNLLDNELGLEPPYRSGIYQPKVNGLL